MASRAGAALFSASSVVAGAGTGVAADAGPFAPTCTLVKVGGGKWGTLKKHDVLAMDRQDMLEALAESKMFGDSLKDIPLDKCSVVVLKGALPAGKEEPDASDEVAANVMELKAAKTVGQAAKEAGCSGETLFIHVRLPGEDSCSFAWRPHVQPIRCYLRCACLHPPSSRCLASLSALIITPCSGLWCGQRFRRGCAAAGRNFSLWRARCH